MDVLQGALKDFARETEGIGIEQTVLDTLTYEEARRRAEQVSASHSETSHWIFDKKFSAGPNSSQTFAGWLRSDDGLYSVQYLHRTLRDFLFETSEMQAFFEGLLPHGYIAQQELCKALLCLLAQILLCPCGCDSRASEQAGDLQTVCLLSW